MENILNLDKAENLKIFGTEGSGHQTKIWIENKGNKYLIKLNSKYREASKEESVSKILKAAKINHVQYKKIKVNYKYENRTACICKSFLSDGEYSIPLYNLLGDEGYTTKASSKELFYQVIKDVIKCIKIKEEDLINGILLNLVIDYLVMNSDRHYKNIEIIIDKKGNGRLAPLFDFGQSFLNRDSIRTKSEFLTLERKFKTLPFSRNPEKNLIDINKAKTISQQIKNNIGDINKLDIPEFHKYVLKHRISKIEKE